MSEAEANVKTRFAAERVSVAYGRANIIEHLDLAIPRGVFTALVGPNGSGKSTLLRALAGLSPLSHGTIHLEGLPISSRSTKDIARRVGVLAQGPIAPDGLTVLDLVRQGRYPHRSLFCNHSEKDDEACREALQLTGMAELASRPLENLSGGQRQRAWIAMTLAQQTPILLLDEPTTYLDLAHQIEVMELIGELVASRGKTVVAVLHDLNQAARYADHIVMLKAGKIAVAGQPGTVMSSSIIEIVYGVSGIVVADPITETPMFVATRSRKKY